MWPSSLESLHFSVCEFKSPMNERDILPYTVPGSQHLKGQAVKSICEMNRGGYSVSICQTSAPHREPGRVLMGLQNRWTQPLTSSPLMFCWGKQVNKSLSQQMCIQPRLFQTQHLGYTQSKQMHTHLHVCDRNTPRGKPPGALRSDTCASGPHLSSRSTGCRS